MARRRTHTSIPVSDYEDLQEISIRILRFPDLEKLTRMNEQELKEYVVLISGEVIEDQSHRSEVSLDTGVSQSIINSLSITRDASNEARDVELLRQIMKLLPPNLLRLVEAHYGLGLSTREIAQVHNLSRSSVHRQLLKASEIIRREFYREKYRLEEGRYPDWWFK
jgi:RNA polymerase sigma factor (sigma-70 family)